MKIIKIESKYEMIIKMIDLALLLKLPEKYNLLYREKQFIAYTILFSNEGLGLESKEMVSKMCEVMGIKKADVYNYRKTLKSKGWLMQTPTGFDLIPFFDFTKKKIPSSLKIDYNLIINEVTD